MEPLSILLIGAIVSGATQLAKRVFPGVQPLLFVGLLSIIVGFAYGFLYPLVPAEIIEKSVYSFSVAVAIFNVLKQFTEEKK
jgi:uncharacterized membrane protein HdeD (DUF308 family)